MATALVLKTGERKPCGFDPHSHRHLNIWSIGRADDCTVLERQRVSQPHRFESCMLRHWKYNPIDGDGTSLLRRRAKALPVRPRLLPPNEYGSVPESGLRGLPTKECGELSSHERSNRSTSAIK